eukprot:TRINITY_DN54551_c0_g1_i1.p1 TRINITY_DN54551_c0_g1~~TRINITY_DN54551_c0_g1_i1.p1  ORF type:complete len:426 (-),score=151.61 TRINITY_DN54551_c0_g1_i1:817-2094(-)
MATRATVTVSTQPRDKLYRPYPEVASIEERAQALDDDKRMPTSELEELVDQLRQDTQLLAEEVKMFASYLKTVVAPQQAQLRVTSGADGSTPSSQDDDGFSDLSEGSTGASALQSNTTGGGGKRPKGRGRRRSSAEKTVMLNVEWKVEIASAEMERLKHDKEEEIKLMEKNQEMVRACMEEAELRIQETRKDMYDFKRDIVGDNKKVMAERILKYLEERVRAKETHVTKMKLKSQALKTQIGKYERQLKQREDMGEVLQPIDFDQLKIENQQFQERIEQKNKELVKLKLTTGNTVQAMNGLTEKLNKFSTEQQWLRKEIRQREEHLAKLKEDITQVQNEKEHAEKKNTQLRLQHEAVKVPKVEDYIQQKAEQYELEKAAANWKRKVEIAEGQRKIIVQQRRGSAEFTATKRQSTANTNAQMMRTN